MSFTDTRRSAWQAFDDAAEKLVDQQIAIEIKVRAINASAPQGLSPAQQQKVDELNGKSDELSEGVRKFTFLANMALNSSPQVIEQIRSVREMNASLRKTLEDVNKIALVINNINGVLATLQSALNALLAVRALLP